MTLFVSLEGVGSIGPLWHATGTNGDAAGARSSKSMINGTTGDDATGTNGDAAGARSSKSMINGTTGDTEIDYWESRDEWRRCWRPLEQVDDQRDDR
ncbi:unnamed protein product [Heligmosomoides polygyrus]|uniref:Uncharacterized protein n=1 Tax=Heligmosomoides polygyrus TaxID=6339 RepID=A0A183FQY6_HELPZ|nr:unnamed protein product [Heligmosomoides polygyrus]